MRRFFVGLAITAMLGIVPCQARGNDRQISQAIVKGLHAEQKSGELQGISIDLEVDDGAVYLKGTVANQDQEELALDIARRVEGVRQVYNELQIRPTAKSKAAKPSSSGTKTRIGGAESSSPDSSTLASHIIARLGEEKDAGNLRGFSVDVEVDDGIAWLTGKVASEEQQDLMLDVVRRVPGVKQVVNELNVSQPGKSPTEIAQEVVARLQEKKASGELRDFGVDVEVDQGVVWLTGHAASSEQQRMILDTARFIPGVTKVVNDISVSRLAVAQAQQAVGIGDESAVETRRPPQPLQIDDDDSIGSAVAAPVRRQASRVAPITRPNSGSSAAGRRSPRNTGGYGTRASGNSDAMPLAFAPARAASYNDPASTPVASMPSGQPVPMNTGVPGTGIGQARFDHPQMPQYSWPSYAPYPNYGAVTYPKQYSPMAWPYIGPFYPYPQVPLGWRKAELKWKDGWWQLDFKDRY